MTLSRLFISSFFVSVFLLFSACTTNEKKEQKITGDVIKLAYNENHTVTYNEAIDCYKKLDNTFATAKLLEYGKTDVGKPLHLFVISKERDFEPVSIKNKGKTILLINNGIHPGEPCGIDASIQFANDILLNKNELADILDSTVICIIPVYSVGGCLNRTKYIRSNQLTPVACGRRGNGRNLDLNRDFVKADSRNAQTFTEIFRLWDPDVFLDTHTTNGSDHQQVITLIPIQPGSAPKPMERFLRQTMLPNLYGNMAKTEYPMVPYVIYGNDNIEQGIFSYLQTARVSTGYAHLFDSFGFMTENLVYKPYPDRVKSVYKFIIILSRFTQKYTTEIRKIRKEAKKITKEQKMYPIEYELDSTKYETILFRGYEKGMVKSELSGLEYFGYDHDKPWEKEVPFYSHYTVKEQIEAPKYYIIPQAWHEAIYRLKLNNIDMFPLENDTSLTVEVYYITEHENLTHPYNGHFYHTKVETETRQETIRYYKGDYIVPVNQEGNKYIVETLEPKAKDSFFRWNFFDTCLEARDWNNPSNSFEGNAIKYLEENPELKEKFLTKKETEPEFAQNHAAQLKYIFDNSEWAIKIKGRYPVARINTTMQ